MNSLWQFCSRWTRSLTALLLLAFTGLLIPPRTTQAAENPDSLRKLAEGVLMFAPIAGDKVLCYGGAEQGFYTVRLSDGVKQVWQSDWDPATGGWDMTLADAGRINGLVASPDGQTVAYALRVGVTVGDAADSYPWTCDLVVLCSADGSGARAVALSELRDGDCQLIFTQDGSRLYNIMYIPAVPTAAGYQDFIASMDTDAGFPLPSFNYVETATGAQGSVEELSNAEFVDACPFSDNLAYIELDSDRLFFGHWFDGPTGSCEAAGSSQYFDWVLPDAVMLNYGGNQELAKVNGETSVVPGAKWRCFCTLPDGSCFFSADGGISISYGKVDWTTRSIDWQVVRPELAGFAEPFDDGGWPVMINSWRALPGNSAVLLREPLELSLYLVRASREGARVTP